MVQDPEHVRGDPGGSLGLVLYSYIAYFSPGRNPHHVSDKWRRPHEGPPWVPSTGALCEQVRPSGADMLVCDFEAAGDSDAILVACVFDG